jgi:hypothetical protein
MPDQGAKPLTLQLGRSHWFLRGLFLDCADNRTGAGQPEAPYELRKQPLREPLRSKRAINEAWFA